MNKFGGVGVAIVTPFNVNGDVDYVGLQKLVNHLISGGVDYLVVQGTTGESPVITASEKRKILDLVIEVNEKRLPIVYGLGGNNTLNVCNAIKKMDLSGVDGLLSVSPYYNKPSQIGLFQHYKMVAEVSEIPVILYNVPSRTGGNVIAETTLKISEEIKGVVAVKEASGDLQQISQIIQHKPSHFEVISGDDVLTLPILALGGQGVISVVANAFPKSFKNMVHKALNGDFESARKSHFELLDIMNLLFLEGNPAGVKEALNHLGLCDSHVRMPLTNVSRGTSELILNAMKANDLVKI